MDIRIQWHGDQFNVELATKEGNDPFISIKGCRIANGSKGEFVSWPATKSSAGKWWNHVYASDKFNDVVLSKARESQQAQSRRPAKSDDSDIPF